MPCNQPTWCACAQELLAEIPTRYRGDITRGCLQWTFDFTACIVSKLSVSQQAPGAHTHMARSGKPSAGLEM